MGSVSRVVHIDPSIPKIGDSALLRTHESSCLQRRRRLHINTPGRRKDARHDRHRRLERSRTAAPAKGIQVSTRIA